MAGDHLRVRPVAPPRRLLDDGALVGVLLIHESGSLPATAQLFHRWCPSKLGSVAASSAVGRSPSPSDGGLDSSPSRPASRGSSSPPWASGRTWARVERPVRSRTEILESWWMSSSRDCQPCPGPAADVPAGVEAGRTDDDPIGEALQGPGTAGEKSRRNDASTRRASGHHEAAGRDGSASSFRTTPRSWVLPRAADRLATHSDRGHARRGRAHPGGPPTDRWRRRPGGRAVRAAPGRGPPRGRDRPAHHPRRQPGRRRQRRREPGSYRGRSSGRDRCRPHRSCCRLDPGRAVDCVETLSQ